VLGGRAGGPFKYMRTILANRLYLPETEVSPGLLENFRHHWDETQWRRVVDEEGEPILNRSGKPKVEKVTIPHTIDAVRHILTGQDTDWIGLPRGDQRLIQNQLRDVVDLRSVSPLGFRLQMGQHVLKDGRWPRQNDCVDAWCRAGSGLVLGQTGAGKTIIGMGCCCRMGLKTLILSKRGEGEAHWEKEFRQHTNVNQLEEQLGRRLIGPYRHKADYPICIATVQTFLHRKGYRKLIQDQFRFGLVIADEIHELVAPEFIRVFSLWAPLSWLGLTATPERPDHREFLAYRILGPVVAKLQADQMRPIVKFIGTGFVAPDKIVHSKYKRHWIWGKLLALLCDDQDRIDCIVRNVAADIDDGRLIAVVGERKQIIRAVHDHLKEVGYDVAYADGSVPKKRREQIYKDVAAGKYRCLCAGKVLDAMVSIKPLDCLHLVTPVAAEHRIKQIFGRTRRPDEGKLVPLIRYYVDEGGQLSGAFRKVVKVVESEGWEVEKSDGLAMPKGGKSWLPKSHQSRFDF